MGSLKDKAYSIIHDKIITCELMPGDIIDEKSLILQTGCSRTPVREALTILARDGLVRIVPRRGMFVSEISVKDIKDIYELKRELEPIILRECWENIPNERLIYFQQVFQTDLQSYNYTLADAEFHAMILDSCDNNYYRLIMNIVSDQSQRIRILTNENPERLLQSSKEHLMVIDALLKKDIDAAAKAMRIHYQNSLDNALKMGLTDAFVISAARSC